MDEGNNDESFTKKKGLKLKNAGLWAVAAVFLFCALLNRPIGIYNIFYIAAAVLISPPIVGWVRRKFGRKAIPVICIALAAAYMICSVLSRTYFDGNEGKETETSVGTLAADSEGKNAKTYSAKQTTEETTDYEYICFEKADNGSVIHRAVTSETTADAQKKIFNELNRDGDENYVLWLFSDKQKAMDGDRFDIAELRLENGEIAAKTPEEYEAEIAAKQNAAAEAEREKAEAAAKVKSDEATASESTAPKARISDSTTSNSQTSIGNVVYATPSGSRYHLKPKCGGDNSSPITLDEALGRGLTPCKKCANG